MEDVLNESYAIWDKPNGETLPFSRQLDSMLINFNCVYYPEEEWGAYNFRPPEHSDLLGAWRTQSGEAFIFLLTINNNRTETSVPDYRVLLAGHREIVRAIGKQIISHKGILEQVQRRELSIKKADENFTEEIKTKSLYWVSGMVFVFTIIINAFSIFFRSLPVPDLQSETLVNIYKFIIVAFHISAIGLLLVIVLIAFAYLIKFGALLVRRRK
jgi:hypothetical protein